MRPLVPGMIKIRWSVVVLRHGPRPPVYRPPDWARQGYYDAGGFDHGIRYTKADPP